MSMKSVLAAAAVTVIGLGVTLVEAAGSKRLDIDVYNPGAKGIFAVSSEVISGSTEVVLVDAQFQRSDAEALVGKLKATCKPDKRI